MVVHEGSVECVRHADGRVEISQAPPITRIALEFLAGSDPVTVKVQGSRITFGGQVAYRVTGWDGHGQCLLAQLVEDRRSL